MFTASAAAAKPASPRRSTSFATSSSRPWGCAASTPSPRSTTTCWRFRGPIATAVIVRGAIATKQSTPCICVHWIASRSLSSGAYSRDPLARNDGLQGDSHRRRDAVAADVDAGDEADDRRIRRHQHFLFAVLVLDQNDLAVGPRDCLGDGGVGHGRVGTKIPGPETFGYAALAFREDLNGERPLAAVGLGHRGHADVRTRLDFREIGRAS